MTAVKHTPGPWKVFHTTNGQTILGIGEAEGSDGITDANFGLWRSGPEREANARLIAAAPDMLAALKAFIAAIDRAVAFDDVSIVDEITDDIETAARAAISKAEAAS